MNSLIKPVFISLGLAISISIATSQKVIAEEACSGVNKIGYTCYEEGIVNARTGYPETRHFNGQPQAGRGFVITRVEWHNEAQFGSISGPNIKKIQANSKVEMQTILEETTKQLEESINKAKAEYKNVKYMAEAFDRFVNESASRKAALEDV